MLLLLTLPTQAATPDPLVGYWSSVADVDVEIAADASGALSVTFETPVWSAPCAGAARVGDTVTCKPGGSRVYAFHLHGDVLVLRVTETGKPFTAIAFVREAGPTVVKLHLRTKEAQLQDMLGSLTTSQLAYDAAFDTYVPCPIWPRPVASLNGTAVPFYAPGMPEAYATVGFARSADPTPATFQVDVAADNRSFTVQAWADLDGDGKPQHWQATSAETRPRRLTPAEVH